LNFRVSKRSRIFILVGLGVLALAFILTTRINFKGHYEGLFLLKGKEGALFELKDDLFLGDGSRLILALDVDGPRERLMRFFSHKEQKRPYLYYEWDSSDGTGFVRNYLPGGCELLTCFGRFIDDGGKEVQGLFVGGGLPSNVHGDDEVAMDETGMAYNDGKRWYHIWCTSNEGLASARTRQPCFPSSWKFLGSSILNEGNRKLAIRSSHEAMVDGVPLRVDRYAYFRAGKTFFKLSIWIKNTGDRPVSIYYVYGDEPWLGDYGTSAGNVGWVKDGVVRNVSAVDTDKYTFAGMFDFGNELIGEKHNYTGVADFLEWLGNDKPFVYFSNSPTEYVVKGTIGPPLNGESRYIGLQWGPKTLAPGEKVNYMMAIGMAGSDPKTGFPVKPDVTPPK